MTNDDGVTPVASGLTARQAPELTAEWALWGKRDVDTVYHVIECSAGTLTARDFADIVDRYAPGTADRLPQYTVGWLPGADGAPEFVAFAIHEHAPYGQAPSRGRSRYDALGREIVFVRLFCVRYADLAEHGMSYAELLDAVQRQELPPSAGAIPDTARQEGKPAPPPVVVRIPSPPPPPPIDGPAEELAEVVAVLLLTTAQVCVFGADEVPAEDRLAFFDLVMSLLPYGLRATLSASTWASSTAQDLKLRLFFASAPRRDNRTRNVRWGQPDTQGFPAPDSGAARLYLDWLRRMGPRPQSVLAEQTVPRRFAEADIRQMVAALPRALTVADTLEDLAASLGDGDGTAARAEMRRLSRHLGRTLDPADRDSYRRQIAELGLLRDHPGLQDTDKARVYRALLSLAFEAPLSYASYCEIETCSGGPRGTLRTVMLNPRFEYATFLPWLLAAKAEPGFSDEELMEALAEQGLPSAGPLAVLQRDAGKVRREHRRVLYDFGVRYLRRYAEDPRGELVRHGYLADTLEGVFPGDQEAQRVRLEDTLRFVYGGPLSRGQIRELFADPELRPTAAFEAAVTQLASSPKTQPFIAEQASYARLRYPGDGDQPQAARGRARLWRPRNRHRPPRSP